MLAGNRVLEASRPPRSNPVFPNSGTAGTAPWNEAPKVRVLSSATSITMASTKICLRGESSFSITRRSTW
jgi:hypothetical protein